MNSRSIRTVASPLCMVVGAAPSKSATHRALIAAALASGNSTLSNPLAAADTRTTASGLAQLGIGVDTSDTVWRVAGGGGRIPGGGALALGESGTSLRLLLALAAAGERPSMLDGGPRLRERPIAELVEALRRLGGTVTVHGRQGGLPAEAGGRPLRGGPLSIAGERSSQFASALLLIAPCLREGIDLSLTEPVVSLPYVELTAQVLAQFGARVRRAGELRWVVAPGSLCGTDVRIEGDHSSASYFLAAAALVGGSVRVEGLDPGSAQPDARFGRFLADLGCRVRSGPHWIEVAGTGRIAPFDVDLRNAPDLAPTVAILALFAEGPCRIRGVAHLRLKETDRLSVLVQNLERFGRRTRAVEDGLEVGPPEGTGWRGGLVATGSDHRIAMAFAVAGLHRPGVVIDDAECVAKSYPDFWKDFARLEGPQAA